MNIERLTVMSLRALTVANDAQVIGEGFVGRGGVEVPDLGVDVELQQERHLGVVGGLPDDDAVLVAVGEFLRDRAIRFLLGGRQGNHPRPRWRGRLGRRRDGLRGRWRGLAAQLLLQPVERLRQRLLLVLHGAKLLSHGRDLLLQFGGRGRPRGSLRMGGGREHRRQGADRNEKPDARVRSRPSSGRTLR
jgi:hypothetical protein